MRAPIRSPWVRARRRYSGGKMWQWRSTPYSERFLESVEHQDSLTGWLISADWLAAITTRWVFSASP